MDCVSKAVVNVVATLLAATSVAAVQLGAEGVQDVMENYIVEQLPRSELQQFADWFHQDWKILFGDVHHAAKVYWTGISEPRRLQLQRELTDFLRLNASLSNADLLKAWHSLGAGWQKGLDIRPVLEQFAKGVV